MSHRAVVVVCGAIVVVSCAPDYEQIARQTFSTDRSCPLDRVAATARPDLSWYDLTGRRAADAPPPEAAADPVRARAWQARQDEERAASDKMMKVQLVTGCNEKRYYACSRAKYGPACSAMTAEVP